MTPEIRFARNGDIAIAYMVVGDGPRDIVYVQSINNLEVVFENPLYARFLSRLARSARVVVIDRRGTGVSDRLSARDLPPMEDLADDVDAVLDAVGAERVTLVGLSDMGVLCALYAATRPDRVSALVLYASAARGVQAPDYPWQWTEEEWAEWLERIRTGWGTSEFARWSLEFFIPSLADDPAMRAWWERYLRLSTSPAAQVAMETVYRDTDIRRLLPTIGVPTLVLHRSEDQIEPVEAGRYLAEHIPGAQYVELEGRDHFPWAGDQEAVVHEIERFLAAVRDDEEESANRVLATLLFTDIVDSTAQAVALGDRRWRELREQHDQIVRAQLTRFRGREVKTMGDGFLAVFDGPARGVRCASAVCQIVSGLGIEVRAGLHTGEIELDGRDVAGVAVAIGARVGSLAGPGEVLVSSTVKDLVVGSGLAFEDRGTHELKGVPETWHLFAVEHEGERAPTLQSG